MTAILILFILNNIFYPRLLIINKIRTKRLINHFRVWKLLTSWCIPRHFTFNRTIISLSTLNISVSNFWLIQIRKVLTRCILVCLWIYNRAIRTLLLIWHIMEIWTIIIIWSLWLYLHLLLLFNILFNLLILQFVHTSMFNIVLLALDWNLFNLRWIILKQTYGYSRLIWIINTLFVIIVIIVVHFYKFKFIFILIILLKWMNKTHLEITKN